MPWWQETNGARKESMEMQVLLPDFEKRGGLINVVVQDLNGRILMVAHTDLPGYLETLATGKAVFFSTSRNERWLKGETSGDTQDVKRILIDCDGDAIIYQVVQNGDGACHTRAKSCFYRSVLSKSPLMKVPKAASKDDLPLVTAQVNEIFRKFDPKELDNLMAEIEKF